MGYETYGTLNPAGDNAILISHYFSAFGHAAGKYTDQDPAPGFWDGLIGPGKTIDTDRFFVISPDNLCNIQVKNPLVVTTGPASTDPETGRPYGMRFPVVTTVDLAAAQKLLCQSLGIRRLYLAGGPSLGGMIALQLAIRFPDFVERLLGVVTSYRNPVAPSFQFVATTAARLDPNYRDGDYYGGPEPDEAMLLVAQNLTLSAFTARYLERIFPRAPGDEAPYRDIHAQAAYETALYKAGAASAAYSDFNSWLYASRITMNHDVAHGFPSLEEAVARIQASTLLVANRQDLLEDWQFSAELAQLMERLGKQVNFQLIDDEMGHMAGIYKTGLFAEQVARLLEAH